MLCTCSRPCVQEKVCDLYLHQLQGSDATVEAAATSPRPFTAPVGSLHRLATLPHLLSQPSEMPASWNTPPTPSQPQPALVVEETAVVPGAAQQELALQELRTHQVEQQQHIQSLQADVARCVRNATYYCA